MPPNPLAMYALMYGLDIWYGKSLFDIIEKTIQLLLQYLIKYMICLETTQRIHRVLAAMQPPRIKLKYTT